MDSRFVLVLVLVGACKAELADAPVDSGAGGPNDSNGSTGDGGQPPLGPWGAPTRVPGADTGADEDDATLSSDRLELYFKREDTDNANLYVMTRATTTSAWGAPVALTVLNSTVDEESPRLSADELTLYFGRNGDIYRSTRVAIGSAWSAATAVTTLNTAAYEKWAAVCANGYAMVSRLVATRGHDMFEGDITTGATTAVPQLNSTSADQGTFLTGDCLRVYYQSNRDNSQFNIYLASRAAMNAAWSNASVLGDFNTGTFSEEDPWISSDQRTFLFASDSAGSKDLYISTR